MKQLFLILGISISFFSCSRKTVINGDYYSNISSVTFIENSHIHLSKDGRYIKRIVNMNLEFITPSVRISEIKGRYVKSKNKIELIPMESKTDVIIYGKNNDIAHKVLSNRINDFVAVDTVYGKWKVIKDQIIFLTLTQKKNTVYLKNEEDCYFKNIMDIETDFDKGCKEK